MGRFVMLKHTVYHSTDGSIIDQDFKSCVICGWQKGTKLKANRRLNDEYGKLLKYIEKHRFLDETEMITLDSSFIDNKQIYAYINFREASRLRGKDFMAGYLYTSVEWRLIPTKFLEYGNNDKLILK